MQCLDLGLIIIGIIGCAKKWHVCYEILRPLSVCFSGNFDDSFNLASLNFSLYPAVVAWFVRASVYHSVVSALDRMVDWIPLAVPYIWTNLYGGINFPINMTPYLSISTFQMYSDKLWFIADTVHKIYNVMDGVICKGHDLDVMQINRLSGYPLYCTVFRPPIYPAE